MALIYGINHLPTQDFAGPSAEKVWLLCQIHQAFQGGFTTIRGLLEWPILWIIRGKFFIFLGVQRTSRPFLVESMFMA